MPGEASILMQVLKALAELPSLEVETKLHQLRIMNFLTRELSLEFDVQQFAHLAPAMAAAATMLTTEMNTLHESGQALLDANNKPPRTSQHGGHEPKSFLSDHSGWH